MSGFEPFLWAWKSAPVANGTEKGVLLALAERADADGCNAAPSKATIAARAMIDPKTVQRHLRALEERGLISPGDQSVVDYLPADKRPRVYDINIPYSWFPDIEEINRDRISRGRPPLKPEDRPNFGAAPERKTRSDKGAQRGDSESPRADLRKQERGDSESPGTENPRGTVSSERGDCESPDLPVTTFKNNHSLPSGESDAQAYARVSAGARDAIKIDGVAPMVGENSSEEISGAAAKPVKPVKVEFPLPADWWPTAEQMAKVQAECPGIDHGFWTQDFVRFWTEKKSGKKSTELGWYLTWLKWIKSRWEKAGSPSAEVSLFVAGPSEADRAEAKAIVEGWVGYCQDRKITILGESQKALLKLITDALASGAPSTHIKNTLVNIHNGMGDVCPSRWDFQDALAGKPLKSRQGGRKTVNEARRDDWADQTRRWMESLGYQADDTSATVEESDPSPFARKLIIGEVEL